ncbi:MAG: helix-turn-helix transcriptional regulator [Actinobacteria bacterium]|nr:helix-turn-helix transcriptional regulator [Actinomycetota bacterium]
MRSYGQFCAVARSLDVIGDRWSLLIVRELLIRGACRYSDLQSGLPGIATNMLAGRLRELEASGVITALKAEPPVATRLFELTERGRQLERVLDAIAAWGGPLMASVGADAFHTHWLLLPVRLRLVDNEPERPSEVILIRIDEDTIRIDVDSGAVTARLAVPSDPDADAEISGGPELVLAVLLGRITLQAARERGLIFRGSERTLARVQPRPPTATLTGSRPDASLPPRG